MSCHVVFQRDKLWSGERPQHSGAPPGLGKSPSRNWDENEAKHEHTNKKNPHKWRDFEQKPILRHYWARSFQFHPCKMTRCWMRTDWKAWKMWVQPFLVWPCIGIVFQCLSHSAVIFFCIFSGARYEEAELARLRLDQLRQHEATRISNFQSKVARPLMFNEVP